MNPGSGGLGLLLALLLLAAPGPPAFGDPAAVPPWPPSDSLRDLLVSGARDSTLAPWQRDVMRGLGAAPDPRVLGGRSPSEAAAAGDPADGTWSEALAPAPLPRDAHSIVYDAARDRMLVFGGADGAYLRNDTWELGLSPEPAWRRLQTRGTPPPIRSFQAAIYDARNDRMIVHGGYRPSEDGYNRVIGLDDVWALSLSEPPTWSRLEVAGPPPPGRYGHTAVYDAATQRMLVFGGTVLGPLEYGDQTSSPANDVWALDLGAAPAWTPIVRGTFVPGARMLAAAAYDPVGERMLLFGGTIGGRSLLGDLWSLQLADGVTWGRIPSLNDYRLNRAGHSCTYDPVRRRLVVLGGYRFNHGEQILLGDALSWSLDSDSLWRPITTAVEPEGRAGHVAIYDPGGDRIVVFGGIRWGGVHGDTWELRLRGTSEWRPVETTGPAPPARAYAAAVLDPRRSRMVLFAGWNGTSFLNDVWQLDLGARPAWTALAPRGTPPGPRDGMSAIYDPLGHRMIVFGGNDGPTRTNETWVLSLGPQPAWSRFETRGDPPSPRFVHTAVFDAPRRRMVIHGGSEGPLGDTWALSLDTRRWEELRPTPEAPAPRSYHASVWDPLTRRMVVYGGHGGWLDPRMLGDTWALELEQGRRAQMSRRHAPRWRMLAPDSTGPGPRDGVAAVLDPGGRRMLILGGNDGTRRFDDVWSLDLAGSTGWSQVASSGGSFSPRFLHAAAWDPVRSRAVAFGGSTGDGLLGDVQALDVAPIASWRALLPGLARPDARNWYAGVLDPVGDRMLFVGGGDQVWGLSLSSLTWHRIAENDTGPGWRYGSSIAYDSKRDRLLLFGGDRSPRGPSIPMNDAWALKLSGEPAWERIAGPTYSPVPRKDAAAAYDPIRDRLIIQGGTRMGISTGDTWALSLGDPVGWTQLIPCCSGPGARTGAVALYDPRRRRMLLYGGRGVDVLPAGDLQAVYALPLDGPPVWSALPVSGPAPDQRYGHTAAYDSTRDRLLVYGGLSRWQMDRQTWSLSLGDGSEWTRLSPLGDLLPRSGHAAVYDARRDRMVVAGGWTPVSDWSSRFVHDVWTLSWGEATASAAVLDPATEVPPPARPAFALGGAVPHPASSELVIAFSLPDGAPARLELFDLAGRRLAVREVSTLGPGSHRVALGRGLALAPGAYFVRLRQSGRTAGARVVVVVR